MWFGCFRLAPVLPHSPSSSFASTALRGRQRVKRQRDGVGATDRGLASSSWQTANSFHQFVERLIVIATVNYGSQNIGELRKKPRCWLRASKDPRDRCVRLKEREKGVRKSWYGILFSGSFLSVDIVTSRRKEG